MICMCMYARYIDFSPVSAIFIHFIGYWNWCDIYVYIYLLCFLIRHRVYNCTL